MLVTVSTSIVARECAPTFVKSGTTVPSCRWKRVSTFAGVPVGFAIASRVSKNVPVAPSAR